jgi:hypothetical protein
MHDREARPTGAVNSTAVIANETMILLTDFAYSTDEIASRETISCGRIAVGFSFAFRKAFCEEQDMISFGILRKEL